MRRPVLAGALVVLCSSGGAAATPDAGKDIYEIRCAPGHGTNGEGDGPGAGGLEPKPRNFREAAFWKGRTREQVRDVVLRGKPNSLMGAFGVRFGGPLADDEIDHVVSYLETFRPKSP